MAHNDPGRARPLILLCYQYKSITHALKVLGDDLPDAFLKTKSRKAQIQIISYRLIAGWSTEEAFGYFPPPKSAEKGYAHPLQCGGLVFPSKSALAKSRGITKKLLGQRMSREKWSPEVAAELVPPPHYAARLGASLGCVYMWNHISSGKKYIGLTIDRNRRNWQHVALSKSKNLVPGTLQHAMAEFGRDQFEFLILEDDVPASDLPARERHWIKLWGTLKPNGYNQNAGGVFGGMGSTVVVDGVTYAGFRSVAERYKTNAGKVVRRMSLGWSLEDAVGMTGRKPKTRSPITINVFSKVTEFKSSTAACRYWGLRHSDVARSVKRGGKDWDTAINNALIVKTHMAMQDIDVVAGISNQRRGRLLPSLRLS
ncbi:hypothetical protein GCM10010909_25370 [Acidocella aquatica]|uniref:GIY-YIG domain-containing protein n=1 Tax=Acidocella aquatica TaxID=1922313 RepID=A0ABQ6A7K7_9PROT|nr:GIY-YIG nuclease family protein [Acidocella aquatica]GLR67856.1 hypothetical protein GCM10010909_25370 [Acidocella aquatica]